MSTTTETVTTNVGEELAKALAEAAEKAEAKTAPAKKAPAKPAAKAPEPKLVKEAPAAKADKPAKPEGPTAEQLAAKAMTDLVLAERLEQIVREPRSVELMVRKAIFAESASRLRRAAAPAPAKKTNAKKAA